MTAHELTERAKQAVEEVDAGVRRLQASVLEALVLMPPSEWRATLDRVCHQLDELLMNAEVAQSSDPILRARRMSFFPELLAERDRKLRAARRKSEQLTDEQTLARELEDGDV